MPHQPDNIFAGTQVVSLVEVRGTNRSRGPVRTFWRKVLQGDFERTLAGTRLPEHPKSEAANRFIIKVLRDLWAE